MYNRVHAVLKYVVQLVPTAASGALSKAIVTSLPHEKEKWLEHTVYYMNLLRVADYAPAQRRIVLETITRILLQYDVQIQEVLEEMDDEVAEALARMDANMDEREEQCVAHNSTQYISQELAQQEAECEDGNETEDEDDEDFTAADRVADNIHKLDAILELLFDYYSLQLPSDPKARPSAASSEAFDFLFATFENTIFRTHHSRYTQFLLFWAVQQSPSFVDLFLGTMIDLATDATKPRNARLSGAAYISSFVARAKCLDVKAVQQVVVVLCQWLEKYMDFKELECLAPDLGKFGGFYGVCQAVMYIFCFRWRDLKVYDNVEDRNLDDRQLSRVGRWLPELRTLKRAISSRFNPLKICSRDVVEQFAEIARHLQFAYVFDIIEYNKRVTMDRRAVSTVDAFFPFDPFRLRRSKKWVEAVYVNWQPIEGLEEAEEGDEMSEDEHDTEEEDEY